MAIYELGGLEEERRKTNLNALLQMGDLAIKASQLKMESDRKREAQEAFNSFAGGVGGSGGMQPPKGMVIKPSYTVGPNGPSVSYTIVPDPIAQSQQKSSLIEKRQKRMADYIQQLRGQAPLTGGDAGRYALSRETVKLIPEAKKILFPDGTSKTFNRTLAASFMVGKIPNSKEAQNLKRIITKAATARGLIQSGTVVKDNEWSRIINDMFGVDAFSNPDTLMSALGEEETFHKEFMTLLRPGFKGGTSKGGDSEDAGLMDAFNGI